MIIVAAEHFLVLSTALALLAFVVARGARALAFRRLIVHPHTLANLYAVALAIPPLGAAWLVAATFLPVWWLSETAFEGAHQWPRHDVHLLAGVLGETEWQFALASAALLTALIAALIVASLRGRVAVRRALDALPGSCPRTYRPRTAQALPDSTRPAGRGRLRLHEIPADYPIAFVWGLRRTRLILSSGLIALLSPDQLRAVVAHERAHHDRRDNLGHLVLLICAYASLAMPLSRRVLAWYSEQVELVCDEVAARATRAPLDLAAALVSIRRSTLAGPPLVPVAMPGISALEPRDSASFERRVRRLLALCEGRLDHQSGLARSFWPLARLGLVMFALTIGAVALCAPLATHHAIEACLRLLG